MPKKEDKIISWLKETDTHLMYDSHKEGDGITLSDSGVIGIADSSTGFTFILDANA